MLKKQATNQIYYYELLKMQACIDLKQQTTSEEWNGVS